MRANPQLRAVRLNIQNPPAALHGQVAAAVGMLHALAVLCLSCDIQAADAAWFCPLVQLPWPSEMLVTLRGLYTNNLVTKAAVLLGTPQARISSLQPSGAALQWALPSLHKLPRLLILSLEKPGLEWRAQFQHQHMQWPPFPQLQRLELSTDEVVARCGAALIAAAPLLESLKCPCKHVQAAIAVSPVSQEPALFSPARLHTAPDGAAASNMSFVQLCLPVTRIRHNVSKSNPCKQPLLQVAIKCCPNLHHLTLCGRDYSPSKSTGGAAAAGTKERCQLHYGAGSTIARICASQNLAFAAYLCVV